MTTNTGTVQFDRASLHALADLVAAPWRFVTGEPLPERPGSLLAFDDVVLAVEGHEVTLHSELVDLGFEGFAAEYPHLTVLVGADGLDEAGNPGEACSEHQGAEVVEILVVRETITASRDGGAAWVYCTDIGLVFDLSGGALGVVKASHHNAALLVSIADSVAALDLPDRTIEWDGERELGAQYRSTREFIPLATLLRA